MEIDFYVGNNSKPNMAIEKITEKPDFMNYLINFTCSDPFILSHTSASGVFVARKIIENINS